MSTFGRSFDAKFARHLVEHDDMLQVVLLELGDFRAERFVVETLDARVISGDRVKLKIRCRSW